MKAVIAGTLVAYLSLAHAGVFYQTSSRDLTAVDAKPVLIRGYAQDGRLREEEGEGWSSVVITTAQTVITINIPARSYQLMDEETLTRIGTRERASYEKNVSQRARLPAKVRAMLELVDEQTQRALAMEKQPLDYRATDQHEVVAGFSCSIWDYYWRGSKEAEYCIAPPASIPGGAEWMAALRAQGDFYTNAGRWLGDPARLLFASTLPQAEAPSRLNGVLLMSRTFQRGKAVSETRVTTERVEPLSSDLFVVSKGYERQPAESARPGE
jgi:hypothetical protein